MKSLCPFITRWASTLPLDFCINLIRLFKSINNVIYQCMSIKLRWQLAFQFFLHYSVDQSTYSILNYENYFFFHGLSQAVASKLEAHNFIECHCMLNNYRNSSQNLYTVTPSARPESCCTTKGFKYHQRVNVFVMFCYFVDFSWRGHLELCSNF